MYWNVYLDLFSSLVHEEQWHLIVISFKAYILFQTRPVTVDHYIEASAGDCLF